MRYFLFELSIFFSKLLSATNQQLFCIYESAIGQGLLNHILPSMNYRLQYCDLHGGSDEDLQKNALKI